METRASECAQGASSELREPRKAFAESALSARALEIDCYITMDHSKSINAESVADAQR